MNEYKIWTENDIIIVEYPEFVDEQIAQNIYDEFVAVLTSDKNKKKNLVDFFRTNDFESAVRRNLFNKVKKYENLYDKTAIVGINSELKRTIVNVVLALFSPKHPVKLFSTREEGLVWLRA